MLGEGVRHPLDSGRGVPVSENLQQLREGVEPATQFQRVPRQDTLHEIIRSESCHTDIMPYGQRAVN